MNLAYFRAHYRHFFPRLTDRTLFARCGQAANLWQVKAAIQRDLADVNGKPTLLIRRADGTPAIVVSLEVGEARVHSIWVVANPDKLGAVA